MPYQNYVDVQQAVERPLWRAMLAADHPMSVPELHREISANPASIRLRLKTWQRAGLVEQIAARPNRYTMTEAARAAANDDNREPPKVCASGDVLARQRPQRARLWSAMRVLRRFSVPELMIAANATTAATNGFVNGLRRAGYLKREPAGRNEWSTYVLVNRSGPKAPQLRYRTVGDRRQRYLFDPNNGSEIDVRPGVVRLIKQPERHKAPAEPGGEG